MKQHYFKKEKSQNTKNLSKLTFQSQTGQQKPTGMATVQLTIALIIYSSFVICSSDLIVPFAKGNSGNVFPCVVIYKMSTQAQQLMNLNLHWVKKGWFHLAPTFSPYPCPLDIRRSLILFVPFLSEAETLLNVSGAWENTKGIYLACKKC